MPRAGRALTAFAAAKVNLALAVTGRRDDGYHTLDSLVAFADVGDTLVATPGDDLTLIVDGPMGAGLDGDRDNMVLRAARVLRETVGLSNGAALRLDKTLPVAAGIGGGSADAAAALRLLSRLWDPHVDRARLPDCALRLGADVPVCLASRACRMSGIGETLTPVALPSLHAVLVNPGRAVSTADVFAALEHVDNPPLDDPPQGDRIVDWLDWVGAQRNDLAAAAFRLEPSIGTVLDAIGRSGGIARMSGSGATCVGLYRDGDASAWAADALRNAYPSWWVADCTLGDAPDDTTGEPA